MALQLMLHQGDRVKIPEHFKKNDIKQLAVTNKFFGSSRINVIWINCDAQFSVFAHWKLLIFTQIRDEPLILPPPKGLTDNILGFLLNLFQVGLALETFSVNLVDFLGARGSGRKPSVFSDDL